MNSFHSFYLEIGAKAIAADQKGNDRQGAD